MANIKLKSKIRLVQTPIQVLTWVGSALTVSITTEDFQTSIFQTLINTIRGRERQVWGSEWSKEKHRRERRAHITISPWLKWIAYNSATPLTCITQTCKHHSSLAETLTHVSFPSSSFPLPWKTSAVRQDVCRGVFLFSWLQSIMIKMLQHIAVNTCSCNP